MSQVPGSFPFHVRTVPLLCLCLPSFYSVFLSFSICPCLHKAQRHGHVFKLCSPRIVVISHSSLCCYCWLVLFYFFRQVFCRHFSALKFNICFNSLCFLFSERGEHGEPAAGPRRETPPAGPAGRPCTKLPPMACLHIFPIFLRCAFQICLVYVL